MTSHQSLRDHENQDLHQNPTDRLPIRAPDSRTTPSTTEEPLSDNSSLPRSHEGTQPQPRPLRASRGSDRFSNKGKAPAETRNTAPRRSQVLCKFYAKGCRAGAACPFRHPDTAQAPNTNPASSLQAHDSDRSTREAPQIQNVSKPEENVKSPTPGPGGPRSAVAKPVPASQQQDPRAFQINQVTRRFSPVVEERENGTVLVFKLAPSDPDFPFELDGLRCRLTVPKEYPQNNARPTIRVTNTEMERGHQINCERGFDALVGQNPNRSLLSLLNQLDKNLEAFLTAQKAQTIKIVAHASKPESSSPSASHEVSRPQSEATVPSVPVPQHSESQKTDARAKRESDVRQLEARLRNVPGFSKNADSFNVPLSIPKPARLPITLQPLKEATLLVPKLYNLEPCTIKLKGVYGEEIQRVEKAFYERAKAQSEQTLMAHVNFLSQNMHSMAQEQHPSELHIDKLVQADATSSPSAVVLVPTSKAADNAPKFDADRPHIQIIPRPRPPEWDEGSDGSDDDSSGSESDDYNSSDQEDEEAEGGASLPSSNTNSSATGNSILLSFPDIELYGIELLEVASLSLTLKCDRCKSTVDAKNIRAKAGDVTTTVSESCPKCAVIVSASFSADPIHANSIKAGHLDLNSCTVTDMLPSIFKPTCSGCSTTYPSPPGVVSVRGETTLAICRECHQKMTFKLPEAKFLRVSSALASSLPLRQKKKKENLGIVSGTPLPNFGKCSHYRKSHRWFRFSCCNKVYACDRCHDEQADPKHPNEHANRMICGYCSREQNYRPEDCGVCHESLVGRRGGGFWEGGKGTRDPAKMSRKDPRKYKNRRKDVKTK